MEWQLSGINSKHEMMWISVPAVGKEMDANIFFFTSSKIQFVAKLQAKVTKTTVFSCEESGL